MSHETTQPAAPAAPPPAAPSGECANCGAPLYGKYCHACGQPIRGMVRHFSSILSDIADSVLNIDERVFRTLAPLYLQPGKLTLDYFAGKRARYVTPFRLVFFLAIVAFFTIQLTVRAGYRHLEPATPVTASGTPGDVVHTPAPASAGTSPNTVAGDPAFGRKAEKLRAKGVANVFDDGNIAINNKVWWNRDTHPLRVGWLPDPVVVWLNDLIGNAQQQLHAMNTGAWVDQQNARRKFQLGMFSAAPTVLFLLLPVFALMLKVFYIFKRRLYMEHLIVAMHSHAFLMLSMLVLVALGLLRAWLVPHAGWSNVPFRLLETAAWIWMFVYLWLMQKRVYRQGWWMTNLKYWSLGFCYTILAGFGFVFAVLISLTGA